MLADLDDSLQQLLKTSLPIRNGEIDVKFDQPKREWSARLTKPTINLFLYDVRENVALRNHQWQSAPKGSPNIQKRTPFRFDCTYLLTSWASEAEDEHRLLSRAMLALLQHPVLPPEHLMNRLKQQPYDVTLRLGVHDKLTNPAEIWGSLDNETRPTLPYIITLAFDPWEEISGPIVRNYTLRAGRADALPRRRPLLPNEIAFETHYIGGTIKRDGQPLAGVTIALQNTGYTTISQSNGLFILGGIPTGQYTLTAWPDQGKPYQKTITIPSQEGNYDIELGKG